MKRKVALSILLFLALSVSVAFYYESRNRADEFPNLLGNLRYVEQIWDTTYIDLGASAFQTARTKGWSADKTDPDGTSYSETYGKMASIQFSCLNLADRRVQVRCRTVPGCSPTQIMIPIVNGNKLHAQRIKAGFQTYSFDIPGRILNRGVNSMTFYFSFGRENEVKKLGSDFDSIAMQRKEDRETARSSPDFSPFQTGVHKSWFRTSPIVTAPLESTLRFYVHVPGRAALKIGYGLDGPPGSACRFAVAIQPEGERRTELASRAVENRLLFPSSATDYLDLQPFENKVVQIELATAPIPGTPAPEKVYWEEAEVIPSTGRRAMADSSDAGTGFLAKQKPNVIIYLIDAQRADHLMPYGYSRPTSPRINDFAKTAVVFEKAYSQVSWTRASVASIQSGLYPSSHLVEGRLDAFPDHLPNIQGELRKHGYHAYGFVTNGNISSFFNFSKDFDDYIRLGEDKQRKEIHVQSGELVENVESFLDSGAYAAPMFLYVHATDPHAPYTPDPEFSLVIDGCDQDDPEMSNQRGESSRILSKQEIECMESLYDSETRRADHSFGSLLALLKRKNLYDNSIIIVTADHGESFFEHGTSGHGKSLYESEIRVPIIMRFPGNQFAGKRIHQNVRHIDLFPTLLSAVGYNVPVSVQGRNLLPLVMDRPVQEIPVYSELLLDQYSRLSMVYEGYKLIDNGKGGRYELYHLESDPLEAKNLAAQEPIRLNYMRLIMNRWSDEQARRKAALKKPKGAVLDRETEDVLKALGYLQ